MVVMKWPPAAHGDQARVHKDFQVPGAGGLGDPAVLRERTTDLLAAMACNMRNYVGSASTLVMFMRGS